MANEWEGGLDAAAVGVVGLKNSRSWAGKGPAASEVGEVIEDVSAVVNAVAAVVLTGRLDVSVPPVVLSEFVAVVVDVPRSAAASVDSISSAAVIAVTAMRAKTAGCDHYWC